MFKVMVFSDEKNFSIFPVAFEFLQFSRTKASLLDTHDVKEKKDKKFLFLGKKNKNKKSQLSK